MWQNPPARLPFMPRKRKPRDAKAQSHDTSRPLYVMYVNIAFEKVCLCAVELKHIFGLRR
jgi:hypothetical protein